MGSAERFAYWPARIAEIAGLNALMELCVEATGAGGGAGAGSAARASAAFNRSSSALMRASYWSFNARISPRIASSSASLAACAAGVNAHATTQHHNIDFMDRLRFFSLVA